MREFFRGVGLLGHGFAHWRRRPGLMALGLVPAAIVGILFLAGLVTLGLFLPGLTEAMTPFADGWPTLWATVFRVTVGTALVGAALVLVAVSFTALTLLVGEPFYERIWRSVEADHGDTAFGDEYGFWRAVGDGLSLIGRGILIALLAVLLGLIPAVGGVLSTVFAVTFTGWLLADELTSRGLSARGLSASERRGLRRRHRARVLGFGVATQLCFLVPLGAVATMPAAVAGSTLLARSLLVPDAAPRGIRQHRRQPLDARGSFGDAEQVERKAMSETESVVTRSNRGQWEVVVDGRPELSRSFSSREEAVDEGRTIADELGRHHDVQDAEPTGTIVDPQED